MSLPKTEADTVVRQAKIALATTLLPIVLTEQNAFDAPEAAVTAFDYADAFFAEAEKRYE